MYGVLDRMQSCLTANILLMRFAYSIHSSWDLSASWRKLFLKWRWKAPCAWSGDIANHNLVSVEIWFECPHMVPGNHVTSKFEVTVLLTDHAFLPSIIKWIFSVYVTLVPSAPMQPSRHALFSIKQSKTSEKTESPWRLRTFWEQWKPCTSRQEL